MVQQTTCWKDLNLGFLLLLSGHRTSTESARAIIIRFVLQFLYFKCSESEIVWCVETGWCIERQIWLAFKLLHSTWGKGGWWIMLFCSRRRENITRINLPHLPLVSCPGRTLNSIMCRGNSNEMRAKFLSYVKHVSSPCMFVCATNMARKNCCGQKTCCTVGEVGGSVRRYLCSSVLKYV